VLAGIAAQRDASVEQHHGITYVYQQHKGNTYPTREDFYVAAPAVVETKARYGMDWFNARWDQNTLF
jgi:hypothetical protein